ncbi:hypothetical protein KR018_010043, partial [Drosophila ironensis]
CKLPTEPGLCVASILRYTYDPVKNACVTFEYGGCKGNKNNFLDQSDCEKKCM